MGGFDRAIHGGFSVFGRFLSEAQVVDAIECWGCLRSGEEG